MSLVEVYFGRDLAWHKVFCDNEAAVHISKDHVCQSRTKHVAVSFWFVREVQDDGVIKVTAISTKHQLADFLTKSLNKPAFESMRIMTGMCVVPQLVSQKGGV